jgi:hypothetical protein
MAGPYFSQDRFYRMASMEKSREIEAQHSAELKDPRERLAGTKESA